MLGSVSKGSQRIHADRDDDVDDHDHDHHHDHHQSSTLEHLSLTLSPPGANDAMDYDTSDEDKDFNASGNGSDSGTSDNDGDSDNGGDGGDHGSSNERYTGSCIPGERDGDSAIAGRKRSRIAFNGTSKTQQDSPS